ncbi:bile acid-transporting ATPase [Periconia macrospinosa]|uniref:Bile acid-transporting ATPase n=1 Tax=Periconia macrospinosa TaxID=97972 RepID=A0A2V1DXA5_9PLEO|nr:bile acid-transporting ATPase [Periconia macrospinosa]
MFAHCKGPVWRRDDFSRCFELDYLQTLFPLIVCGTSLLYLLFQLAQLAKSSKYHHVYSVLQDPRNVWSIQSPHYDDDDTESDDELARNEEVALHQSTRRQSRSIIAVDRPRGEFTVVVLEEAAVLAMLAVHIAVLFTGAWGHKGKVAAIANIAVWAYVAVLASLRLLFSGTHKWSFPKLWYHTAFNYGFQWCFQALLLRSSILHPRSGLQQKLAIAAFVLNSVLLVIALASRKGNKAVELEYEGDIEPAREPVASVFSLATFSWVDPIVWKGYKKTYELSDVWNLAPKDKAAAVLSNYRQVRKTSALAFHLLKHFKRGLLIQAAWAAMSGFLTFAPTLLLKAILEYVEAPEYTPQNAAWFYVILLFVSGCLSALADGQALWIGRKICIRLRAVIIGEIYAKALKRRAAAGTDKILGEEKKTSQDEQQPGRLKRMMTFGRKKKKAVEDPKQEVQKAEAESQVTTGAIINLMAVDAFKVSEIGAYLHFLWANTPVQVALAVILLYRILGYSSIAGIGMMIFLLPINLYVSKQFAKIQKLILAATDARIHSTNEVLTNIRIIKYFAWEQRFIGIVNDKRYTELKHLRQRYILWAIAATIWSGSPVLITFLSFLVYTNVEKKALIPSVAFTALSLFQILRIPLDQLADMVAHVQESKVSIDRIEEYLSEPETDKYVQLVTHKKDEDGQPIIGFEEGTFSWGGKDMTDKTAADAFKLMDLNLNFKVGALNVVVGPTGSGKTSLLMALLGEMTKLKGDVYLPGGTSREELKPDPDTQLTESVAYCAQQAWLVNGTVKDNITFASKWDAKRYKDVIVACSLQRDLDILDAGDQTIVGEKGVTLSGGQKQRISLARALYSKARHVLLDDVLSAVDSHTAKWIFDKALMGPLMHNRTCILVTHNVSLCLPQAQFAVVVENGRVVTQGTAGEVIGSGKLTEDLSKSRPVSAGVSRAPSCGPSEAGDEDAEGEVSHANGNGGTNGNVNGITESKKNPASNTLDEAKAEGGVKLSIIIMYLRAMGPWYYWIGAAMCFAAQQISSVSTNVWIRTWANAYAERNIQYMGAHHRTPVTHAPTINGLGTCMKSGTCSWNLPFFEQQQHQNYDHFYEISQTSFVAAKPEVDSGYFLGVYAILGVIFMFITFLREGFLFGGSLAASRRIHERLIQKITHAKFRFFDQTPLGQLMNRFSKDIEAVDQEVAPVAIGVVHCLASIITIVILISVITPGFLIAGFFITVLYAFIGRFYINSSRDLKRLESVHRSPLYQQFGETLSGMTTIRAYGDERRFIRENLIKINTQHRPFIYLWAANRWLAFRVDVVGALVSFFAGIFVVRSVGYIDAGAAGLALTYAVTFTENVLWFVRLYSANEQNMNSVERVKEYLDVDQEAAPVVPENRPPSNWPSHGSVEFISYSTRYRPDFDQVLKNITFKILPGEKVGVVGRTGAGKSSLALALFRALEAETGKILVDDIDIGLIGLQDLRENIVMVPQDPTLFTGTIRSNLDPFGLFTDEEIFTALREVHLVSSISTATSGTATPNGPTSPQAIEIPNPTSNAPVSEVTGSYQQSTTNPRSLLSDRTWDNGEGAEEAVLIMPNGTATNTDEQAQVALQADNKNPFRNLNSPVSESGSNLSQGQRQLLCLARALLKHPKVLLMDEATASIDYATDAKIQETIREIKNTTITIAHRLQTIIDYDKVLVLDHGEVIEFGDPFDLVNKNGGSFRSMCEMSGELEALEVEAKKAYNARKEAANSAA